VLRALISHVPQLFSVGFSLVIRHLAQIWNPFSKVSMMTFSSPQKSHAFGLVRLMVMADMMSPEKNVPASAVESC
jgi:hypothetical protein